jgi:probable F420-dependent oxidoreductase
VARPLRVGVQLPEVERDVRWPEELAMARAAEEVGFDSVWVGDHLLYRGDGGPERGPWDAWVVLSAIAAVTERVRLGPLVACAAFHPPGILARMAAGADEVSGGRFVLGIGAGWNETEFRAFGLPFEHRVARFEESFEVVRRLLAGERVTFEGRFANVEDAVLLPPPRRRVPLMIGSSGERVLAAALPHVDAWNAWFDLFDNSPEGFARESAKVDAVAERVGRPPAEIARSGCVLVVLDRSSGERAIPDGLAPAEGTPERIAARLRELAEAGADEAILVVDPITARSIRSLGDTLAALDA